MGDPSTPASGGGWTPPSIEHLHDLLPQYEISRLLGHGGMGAVYEGLQPNLDRKVAIKILPETLGKDEKELNFVERFKLEAKSMARMNHPGIISVYDFGQTSEGQPYYVMEFIDGMDIHQYLKHHSGRLPQEVAIAIIAHVLDALGYAHERGIVHRDIKPANIMIKASGRVKVADFGLVKRLSETGEGSPDSAITVSNVTIGTPDFVAPESLEIGRIVDHRADLYSVGVMFYQLLTGSVPRGNFKPPSGRIKGLDPRLDAIVSRAMESEPDDRYPSAQEFRDAIDEILISPVPEESFTSPVTPEKESNGPIIPGGKRLHLTSVQRKVPAPPKGATGAVPAPDPATGPVSEVKKKNPALWVAAIVLVLAVIGGAAYFLTEGVAGSLSENGKEKGNAKVAKVSREDGNQKPPQKPVRKNSAGDSSRKEPVKKPKSAPKAASTKPRPKPKEKTEPNPPKSAPRVAKATTPKSSNDRPSTKPKEAKPVAMEPKPAPSPSPELASTSVPPSPPEAPASPEDPIAKQLAEIDAKYQNYFEQPYQEALATLNAQFIGALKREEDAISQTGDLDLVLAFENEIQRIGNGEGAGPVDAADVPPPLKALRTTWHTQHAQLESARAKGQQEAHAKRDQSLDLLQQELVKAQDIDAAQRIKALRDRFAAETKDAPGSATTIPVGTSAKLQIPIPLRQAREKGGTLRAWGIVDGKEIDEREFLEDFKGSGFQTIVTSTRDKGLTVLAVTKTDRGTRLVLKENEEPLVTGYREIVAIDRQNCSFYDGEQLLETTREPDPDRVVESFDQDSPLIAGGWNSFFVYRDAEKEMQFTGELVSDHPDSFQALLAEVTKLKPRLVRKWKSSLWLLDHQNQLHGSKIFPVEGNVQRVAVESQPTEAITDFYLGDGTGLHGEWIALGESGAVYAQDRGGFATPVAEWSTAVEIRSFPYNPDGRQFGVLALQKPDGTWRGVGPNDKVNDYIATIGPAIDLSVVQQIEGDETDICLVVWIEP